MLSYLVSYSPELSDVIGYQRWFTSAIESCYTQLFFFKDTIDSWYITVEYDMISNMMQKEGKVKIYSGY